MQALNKKTYITSRSEQDKTSTPTFEEGTVAERGPVSLTEANGDVSAGAAGWSIQPIVGIGGDFTVLYG